MKIYTKQGRLIYDGDVDDNSYMADAVMGDHNIMLYFSSTTHIEIPVGAYCDFQGERFYLTRPENLEMKHSRDFAYTILMESEAARAKIWKFRNPVDGRLKFILTAKPKEHLQMIVDNLNRREGGWTVGECIDDTEHTISYDHSYIIEALAAQATEFKTEYEFKGKKVSLHKVEYNKDNPLPMSYGHGNGFKTGVGRGNQNENPPVEILYVQGGEENIDPSVYGNKELLLPAGGEIAYDGDKFEDEGGFNEATARQYIVSEDRLSIRRSDAGLDTQSEDSLDCSDVYPKRIGKVSEVICVDKDKNFYDFIDNSIPETLNFEDCLIEGEQLTIAFQTGMLAGREFEVKYYHTANTNTGKKGRRFEIVPAEIDGETMPNETFKPTAPNDTYAVFKCDLPADYTNAYHKTGDPKTGAEWDMFRTAVKYKYENEEEKFTFSGTMDGIWAKKDWENIGGRIVLGGFILFSDLRFMPQGAKVRITAYKQYINNPHSPEITLSNATITTGVSSTLKELQAQEVVLDDYRKETIAYTKRRFRDAKETSAMLEELIAANYDTLSEQFTNGITPISIQTMQMLVGDESLQFRYVTSDVNPQSTGDGITYDAEMKQLSAPARIIQHMTLGISSISPSHATDEYHFWNIADYTSASLDNTSKRYYLYAECQEDANTAAYKLSETPLNFHTTGKYNLLVGILNSEYEDARSFVTLYGYTEILPSRITTEKVVSGDGSSFFDMQNNAMKLGEVLDFNTAGDKKLRLRGTLVQSQAGDVSPIGCYRGTYSTTTTYFEGDEVTYVFNGVTSTYRRINPTNQSIPTTNIAPSDTTYWQVIAQGAQGKDGANGTSVSIKGTHLGLFDTMDLFSEAVETLEKGIYIINSYTQSEETTYHWVAKWGRPFAGAVTGWIKSQATLGDGYMDTEGYLYIATELKWTNVGKIKGEDGANGQNGADGKDGVSYIGSDEYYQWHNSGLTVPTGIWMKNQIPTRPTDSTYRYLWNYEVMNMSDGETEVGMKHIMTIEGKGIKSITEYYALSTTSTEPEETSIAWSTSKKLPTAASPYLWNKEVVTFNDNTTQIHIHLMAQRGTNGTNGADGTDGKDGEYTEYRFQRNGSKTTPPTLTTTASEPSGWSLSTPATGLGWYTWATKARKNSVGTLLENWCTPFRITPYDGTDGKDGANGKDGKTPAVIFRGNFDASNTYYGMDSRLDCVKYGETYYITQIDAGTFVGKDYYPTNTSKWNDFGASFDSVATNLLLAEGANIGDWFINSGKIVSTLKSGNKIELDAKNQKILIHCEQGTSEYEQTTQSNIDINIDASRGVVEVNGKDGVSYVTPNGIFANRAGMNCLPSSTGLDWRASVAALGFANFDADILEDSRAVIGVYGSASNSGTAQAFGGYFNQLKVAGLVYNSTIISTSTGTKYLGIGITLVVGFCSDRCNVYLPLNAQQGQVIYFKQWSNGYLRVRPRNGDVLYDDLSQSDYIDFGEGWAGMVMFTKAPINGENKSVWLISKWRW